MVLPRPGYDLTFPRDPDTGLFILSETYDLVSV